MASISQNQYDYLSNLAKAGGGNGEWAKSQLNGVTVDKPSVPAPAAPKPPQNQVSNNNFTPTPYSQGNNFGGSSSVPSPTVPTSNSGSPSPFYTTSSVPTHSTDTNYKGPGSPYIQNTPAPPAHPYMSTTTYKPEMVRGELKPLPQVYAPQYGGSSSNSSSIDTNSIRAEVEARLAKQRAAIAGAVDYTKTGLKNSYDYTRGLQKDERVLQDTQLQRDLNPFSGQKGYKEAMVDRNRSIADTARDKDYNAEVGAADRRLADFNALAPEQADAMYNELLRIERTFGLQVGELTGSYEGQQTLAARTAQQNYDLGLSGLSGQLPGGSGQTLDAKQFDRGIYEFDQTNARNQKVDNWNAYLDSVGLTGNLGTGAKADWSLLGSTNGEPTFDAKTKYLQTEGQRINNEIAKLELANYPQEQRLRIQKLQKEIADIGRAPYQSAVDAEYDKIKLDTAKEQLSQLKSKEPSSDFENNPEFAQDVADPETANLLVTNPQDFINAYGTKGYLALRKIFKIGD